MVLIDTSAWIDHLRHGNALVSALLEHDRAACHPFVVGELACGVLPRRDHVLGLLESLPTATVAEHADVLELVDARRLAGTGISWIDAHLLASAVIERAQLFTLDRRLAEAARRLHVAPGRLS